MKINNLPTNRELFFWAITHGYTLRCVNVQYQGKRNIGTVMVSPYNNRIYMISTEEHLMPDELKEQIRLEMVREADENDLELHIDNATTTARSKSGAFEDQTYLTIIGDESDVDSSEAEDV